MIKYNTELLSKTRCLQSEKEEIQQERLTLHNKVRFLEDQNQKVNDKWTTNKEKE